MPSWDAQAQGDKGVCQDCMMSSALDTHLRHRKQTSLLWDKGLCCQGNPNRQLLHRTGRGGVGAEWDGGRWLMCMVPPACLTHLLVLWRQPRISQGVSPRHCWSLSSTPRTLPPPAGSVTTRCPPFSIFQEEVGRDSVPVDRQPLPPSPFWRQLGFYGYFSSVGSMVL